MLLEELEPEFEVMDEVARGGMGVVYRARQVSLDRIVAVKVLPSKLEKKRDYIEGFKLEAKVLASLNHPHVVAIYDIREMKGNWLIISEFVGGGSLRNLLKNTLLLPLNEACRIVYELCSALYHTHAKGIIHMDMKPDNVLFTENLDVKVADFGLARLSSPGDAEGGDLIGGTPAYMSPEQATGKGIDHRADIYSLGVMFFEMLTGQLPFVAEKPMQYIMKHLESVPTPPSHVNGDVPKWADHVILRCLEKDPSARYQDCKELAKDLRIAVNSLAGVGWTLPSISSVKSSAAWHEEASVPLTSMDTEPLGHRLAELEGKIVSEGKDSIPPELKHRAIDLIEEAKDHLAESRDTDAEIVVERCKGLVANHIESYQAERSRTPAVDKKSILRELCEE